MKLHKVVLKGVARRKKRVLYATIGIVVASMTVVGILTIGRAGENGVYSQLEKYGANLTVVPAVNNIDVKLGNLNLGSLGVGENYIRQDSLPQIQAIADRKIREYLPNLEEEGNIAILAPKLYVTTDIGGTQTMVVGVSPDEELTVKTWWTVTEGEYISGSRTAIAGNVAAEALGLKIGDRIDLKGSQVTLAGILDQTGATDDYQVFVPLATLQEAFGKQGLISALDVRALCNGCPVEIIADTINANISGVRAVAVKQVVAAEMGIVERIRGFMLALAGVTLLVGALGVVNTMIASVHERMRDIGIMKAVGASRRQIVLSFIYEAIVIGIIGGLSGYAAGTVLAYLVGPLVFEGSTVSLVPLYLPISLLLAMLVAIVATLYPALHATKIRIAECFRAT